jgi:hypothetical protein
LLELSKAAGVGSETEAQIVDQENRTEREGFQRIERIARTGDQVSHLPQGVQMGDVVDGKVGKVAVDLAGEHLRPLPQFEQGASQTLPRLGVRVWSWLRGQRPQEHGVIGEVHDSL